MAHAVFINYRGEDSQVWGELIFRALAERFGESGVFLDSSSIEVGDDFEQVLLDRLRGSGVLLVVIGPRWLTAADDSGQRRIDSPADWVRRELVEGFALGLRVIPVLTDDAEMPSADRLPAEIAGLGRRQYVQLRRRYATDDLARLVEKLADLDPGLVVPAPERLSAGGTPRRLRTVSGRLRRRVRLPAPMSGLLGREPELERVTRSLAEGRLVTLIGPGGVGKTRLAVAVAGAVAKEFVDGVVFVPLADTGSATQVLAAVARALEVIAAPGEPLLDTIGDQVAEGRLLLVLDNFEHVLDAGPAVAALLAAAPELAVLVTSREPLGVYGEQVCPVPPLPLPEQEQLPDGVSGVARVLAEFPAVALFDQRARAVNADFALSPGNLRAVVALCRRLDGLPLAIELAAARTAGWAPAALLDRLGEHFDALGPGPRDRPERQQTLRGAVGWSYDLLVATQRGLFRALAVFVGGATAEAVLAVAGAGAVPDASDREVEVATQLASLVDKSLLLVEPEPDGGVRYRMLDTIRAHAAQLLAADPNVELIHARHAAYYVAFAERSGPALAGPAQAEWADRLERNYPNLRAAIGWTLATGDLDSAARACLGLWRYWRTSSHLPEGRQWLAQILAARSNLPDGMRAKLLHPAAVLAASHDEHEVANRLAAESLQLAEAAGDRQTTAQARNAAGIAAIGAGQYRVAAGHFRRSLAIFRDLADQHGAAIALGNLAKLALRLGEMTAASEYIDECLAIERATGNTFGIVLGLETLARILLARGDPPAAQAALRESLTLSRSLGDVLGEAMALHQLGLTAHDTGQPSEALGLLTDALTRRHELDDREDLAISLDCVANVAATRDPALAARLLGAADRLRERYRLPVPSEGETRRDATLTLLRTALDERTLTDARNTGRSILLDHVIDEALTLAALPPSNTPSRHDRVDPPTPRRRPPG